MKRAFKYMVAAVTALCLMLANIPLSSVMVMADGAEYTLSNGYVNEQDTLEFKQGTALLPDNSLNILEPGTITLDYTSKDADPNIHVEELVIVVDGNTVLSGTTGSYQINTKFIVDHYSITQENKGVLELSSINKVTVKSSVVRCLNFRGNALIDGQTQGDPQLNVCLDQAGANNVSIEEYSIYFIGMPEEFTIENPGGMGVEKVGRLVTVKINGKEEKVTARYDTCTYSLAGLSAGEITIELYGDNKPGGVIEWTNYDCPSQYRQNNISAEEQFEHGSAKVVGVYAEDDTEFKNNIMADYGIDEKGCIYDEYGNGCLRIENGYWIAFEFVPQPGYQLVEFGGGAPGQDVKITTGDQPNVYYFQMPAGNCHFKAVFDKPENIVKINGNSIVDDGAIAVAENEFKGGTAQMSVDALDANTSSAYDMNSDVAAALDEKDMEIQEYLSLDLANIYQKANTDDYWEEEYHELTKGKATVTLNVDEGFNPDNNKVYIIHDKGGDEGIETIEAVYDPNTNEITFETGSFSNFMIATSDEANDIEIDPDGPGNPDEPEYEAPRFVITVDKDEVVIGNWEGEDNPFFSPLESGQAIPGDSVIELDLPEDLPGDIQVIYFINGEEVKNIEVGKPEEFSPGHWVTFDCIIATENTIEVYFNECWVIGIDAIADLEMTVLDANGKALDPISEPDGVDLPAIENGDAGEEDFNYLELAYAARPDKVVIKGINGYALFYLECNEDDVLSTPIGENTIKYPQADEVDYIWIGAYGFVPESKTVGFTDSLKDVSAVFEGLTEEQAKDYILVVSEFETADAPEEDVVKIKSDLAAKGYTGVLFPLGFDIDLYDKNGPVHEADFTVKITLTLNKALDLKDGETVVILHVIDDGYELIEAVYDAEKLTLTFETKTFSPFVVTTATRTETTATPTPTEAPKPTETAKQAEAATAVAVTSTGEATNTAGIAIASLMIAAGAAIALYLIIKKDEEKEENPTT